MKFIDPHHDRWHAVIGEDGPMPTPDPCADRLLTLEQWHAVRKHWPQDLQVGVVVPNDTDIESLEPDLPRLALIALQFPKWVDGRAYSQARVLRSRLRFTAELRATGEVLVDMLPLLHRTGFDAVQLRADQSLDSGQRALRFFADHYQGDVHQTQPLFARRAA
ncbi:MAG: DUF934 domain-containing protein [Burkholderiaceae bacterium]|nr:DUF934 domain-containing protein [Burkholderiaceae bacterium]